MILTGPEIRRAQTAGEISIAPFSPLHLNPNSYNFHLGSRLVRVSGHNGQETTRSVDLPKEGFVLEPGSLYLGVTHERIGSSEYSMTLLGRSSIGRLGIFLNSTADLGHFGSDSNWTLEISVVQAVRIFPLMKIGQVAFWTVEGRRRPYSGRYQNDIHPEPSKDPTLVGKQRNG
jgi:dCTP deaminase